MRRKLLGFWGVFSLSLVLSGCGPGVEICDNVDDDDGDGFADCDDSDCAADPACQVLDEICNNAADDDGDGAIDCDDSDCAADPACNLCGNDVIDAGEDCDGADLGGEDCVTQGFDAGTLACNADCTFDLNGCEDLVEICDNGADDDADGDADCADADCAADPICQEAGNCNDAIDNDLDGQVDCADADCAADPLCQADGSCAAPFLAADPSTNAGDNTGAVDISDGSCQIAFGGGLGADLVFQVTPVNTGVLDISMTSATDIGIFVQTTCGDVGTELGCADAFLSGTETLAVAATAGVPVFVFVGAFEPGQEGTFTLDVASRAIACGDGIAEGAEDCDGADLGGADCTDVGLIDGTLACAIDCTFDTAGCLQPNICGNGVVEAGNGEECDDGNNVGGDGCDAACLIEVICGNGVLEPGEQCDDGNITPGDGCEADCTVLGAVTETEPNEDGTPEPGGAGTNGNDFDSVNADGPFSADTPFFAALSPAGDEDVIAVTNPGAAPAIVAFDIFNAALGIGVPCGTSIDTAMHIRDAVGTSLAVNDDRDGANDRCSALSFTINPGETVFAHVSDFGDNTEIPAYFLIINFTECGDGVLEPGEECDDGNNIDGDGCSALCLIEAACGNGILEAGEQCDDGNNIDGDGCEGDCTILGALSEIEPNDTAVDAQANQGVATPDAILIGSINPGADLDFYAVDLVAGTVIRFETTDELGPGSCVATDTVIRLFDTDGLTELDSDDEGSAVGNCSLLDFVVPTSGIFFIQVEDFNLNTIIDGYQLHITDVSPICGDGVAELGEDCDGADLGGATCADFGLVDGTLACAADCTFDTAQCLAPVCGNGVLEPGEQCDDGGTTPGDGCDDLCQIETTLETEPNDTAVDSQASQGAFAPNIVFAGAINPGADLDFYAITLLANDVVTFETTDENGPGNCTGTDTVIRLFNTDGITELDSDDEGSAVGNCSLLTFTAPADGTFFIQVEDFLLNTVIDGYQLHVTL